MFQRLSIAQPEKRDIQTEARESFILHWILCYVQSEQNSQLISSYSITYAFYLFRKLLLYKYHKLLGVKKRKM